MSRLVLIQHNDGEPSGDETVIRPAVAGETALQTLLRKAESHQRTGWTVEWDDDRAFHAWKEYEPGQWVGRKDRYFRLEG